MSGSWLSGMLGDTDDDLRLDLSRVSSSYLEPSNQCLAVPTEHDRVPVSGTEDVAEKRDFRYDVPKLGVSTSADITNALARRNGMIDDSP